MGAMEQRVQRPGWPTAQCRSFCTRSRSVGSDSPAKAPTWSATGIVLFLDRRGNLLCGHDGWIGRHDQGSLDAALPEAAGEQKKEPKLRQETSEPDLVRGDELSRERGRRQER